MSATSRDSASSIDPAIEKSQERFVQETLKFCREKQLFDEGDRVLLAISGGLDSTVLAHVLSRLARLLSIQLELVHVDHGTRAEASSREGTWVEVLGFRLGIKTHKLRIEQNDQKRSQATLRDQRRMKLVALANSSGAHKIVTAHHANDNAETLLMRMMSGTGSQGLAGMSPREGLWVKPLLWATRQALEDYARSQRLGWVEDPSNARSDYLRNRVRHELLPSLETIREGAVQNLAKLASRVEEENQDISRWLEQQLEGPRHLLPLSVLEKYPSALRRRLIACWLDRLGIESHGALVEDLLEQKDFFHWKGVFLRRSDMLVFTSEGEFGLGWKQPIPLKLSERYQLGQSLAWSFVVPETPRFTIQDFSFSLQFRSPNTHPEHAQKLAWDSLPWPLMVRRPLASESWLREVFQKTDIPKVYWSRWPIIASQQDPTQAVAVLGVHVLDAYQLKASERCLTIESFFEHGLNGSTES